MPPRGNAKLLNSDYYDNACSPYAHSFVKVTFPKKSLPASKVSLHEELDFPSVMAHP